MGELVRDDAADRRYEIIVDGDVAGFAEYHLHGGVIAFLHTEVAPRFAGRGLASALIRQALDDARRRGLAVQPFCPYVREFLMKHPELHDLVRPADRDRFDLHG